MSYEKLLKESICREEDLRSQTVTSASQLRTAESSLSTALEKIVQIEKECQVLRDDVDSKTSLLVNKFEEISAQFRRQTDLEAELSSSNEQLKPLQELKTQHSALMQERSVMIDRISKLSENVSSITTQLAKESDGKNAVLLKLAELQQQLERPQMQSQSSIDLEVNCQALVARDSLLAKEIASQASSLGKCSEQINHLSAEKKVMHDQITNLSNALRDMTAQWKSACLAARELSETLDSLKMNHVKEKDSIKAENSRLLVQVSKVSNLQKQERDLLLSVERAASLESAHDQVLIDFAKERERNASSIDMVRYFC